MPGFDSSLGESRYGYKQQQKIACLPKVFAYLVAFSCDNY